MKDKMRAANYLSIVRSLIRAKVFKKRIPLAVSWSLTFLCNQRCTYCDVWKYRKEELGLPQVEKIIDELSCLGTKWISFTGGEPLLRSDLESIIAYAKSKNIYVSVSTNGVLVPEKINILKLADKVKLSLDGPEDVHDRHRGQGSFRNVIGALKRCRDNSISTCMQCVISGDNLDNLDYIIGVAKEFGSQVSFQPGLQKKLWSDDLNPLASSPDEYRKAIRHIMLRKRQGAPVVNSFSGLKYLYNWPQNAPIPCYAGILSCNIEPNGEILACDRVQYHKIGFSYSMKENKDTAALINEMELIKSCSQCWCGLMVDFNLMCSLNFGAVLNYLRNQR